MSYKKFLIFFLTTCLLFAGIYSFFIFRKDPLGYYHLKNESHYYNMNGRFQLPAFIKHLDYDTIIIGPSMSQNFKESVFDRELNVKSFNAALSAASAKEQNYIYQFANKTKKDLQNIYWEINFDSLYGDSDRVDESSGAFPAYLYNTFPLDDIKYLFSYYAGETYLDVRKAEKQNASLRTPYDIYKFGDYVAAQTPDQFKGTKAEKNDNAIPEGLSFQSMKENFDKNILPVLKEHPEQAFILYYTPYPITYHIFNYNRSQQAFIDRLKVKEYIYNQVKNIKNVKVYDFQVESDVTFKISNYLDGTHYFAFINDWMAKQFAEQTYIQSEESIIANNKLLLEQVENFSVKQLFVAK